MTLFLSSVLSSEPLNTIYAWTASRSICLAFSSDHDTSHLARKESLASSWRWTHLNKAFLRRVMSNWAPALSPVMSFWLFSWSFWKAVPVVFNTNRAISSLIFVDGQISVRSFTFCEYCSRSSFDGSSLGTEVAMLLEVTVPLPCVAIGLRHGNSKGNLIPLELGSAPLPVWTESALVAQNWKHFRSPTRNRFSLKLRHWLVWCYLQLHQKLGMVLRNPKWKAVHGNDWPQSNGSKRFPLHSHLRAASA